MTLGTLFLPSPCNLTFLPSAGLETLWGGSRPVMGNLLLEWVNARGCNSKFSLQSPNQMQRAKGAAGIFSGSRPQHLGLKERRLYYEGIAGLRAIPQTGSPLGLMPESPLDGNIGVLRRKEPKAKPGSPVPNTTAPRYCWLPGRVSNIPSDWSWAMEILLIQAL